VPPVPVSGSGPGPRARSLFETRIFLSFPRALWNQTIRQIAAVSIGGKRVRVVLSNEYGTRPLVVGAAHVAVSDKDAAIQAGSDRTLTFGGHASITIPSERRPSATPWI
jgi:hypothetical protein